jgi:hypothetical protein
MILKLSYLYTVLKEMRSRTEPEMLQFNFLAELTAIIIIIIIAIIMIIIAIILIIIAIILIIIAIITIITLVCQVAN